MSGSNGEDQRAAAAPAGWYQDGRDPSLMRWWDGTKWTDHTHRTATRVPQGGAPRKRRVGLLIGIGAGALVVVLVIVLGVQAIGGLIGSSQQSTALSGLSATSRA